MGLTTSIRPTFSRSSDPALAALIDDRLWPQATVVDDADHIPAGHYRAMADMGLFGMVIAPEDGGLGLDPPEVRAVLRSLSSGCGATAFAFAQHHGTTAMVGLSDNDALRVEWLPRLVDDHLAGIAYAHLRRPGPPALAAEPDGEGWTFHGTAPWVTSWGTAAVIGVAAATDDGRIVWALIPATEAPGLTSGKAFDLMVFGATQTVALHFDRFEVAADRVIGVVDADPWRDRDRHLAARPNPLCLGIGDRALSLIEELDPEAAAGLRPRWIELGARAEERSAEVDRGRSVIEVVAATRAESVLAVQRLVTALLAVRGGAGIERAHPAQRLGREAMFYVIQAQNADGRAAIIERLAGATAQKPGMSPNV